ncbi:MAG: energy transducer TonB [Pseudomonadota bacterium]
MSYAQQQEGLTGTKLVALLIALAIVGGTGLVMVIGLAVSAVKEQIERVTTVDIEEPPPEEPDEPPPEQPQETAPPPPVAPPPPISIAPTPPQIVTQQQIPPPAPVALEIPPPAPVAAPAPPPPPPPPPSQARGVQPKGQSRWVARIINDYPSRALRQEEEGTVGVRVTVGTNGRVSDCSVTSGSGSNILDQAACRSMKRYARFDPALNDAGNPITGSWSTRITYRLN